MRRSVKAVNGNETEDSGVASAVEKILKSCQRPGSMTARRWRAGTSGLVVGGEGAVGVALRRTLEEGVWAAGDPEARLRLSWVVLRAGAEPVEAARVWAVAVANDLGTLPAGLERKWWALLDANEHELKAGALKVAVRRVLEALPAGEFERRFDTWTRLLASAETPDLRYGGVTLLNWLLRLAAAQKQARLDAGLYRIAQSNWAPETVSWVGAYLRALATRPAAHAAGCLEALCLHPATEHLSEVLALRRRAKLEL